MHLRRVSIANLFCYIFFFHHLVTCVNGGKNPVPHYIGDVAINCGSRGNSIALDGRQWTGEALLLQPKGKSRSSTASHRSLSADPIPYMTARISATRFSYTFQVNPGQKFIRLHFNPSSYRGFEKSHDFFTVKAGPFTLLKNFSASLAADAMGATYLVKEFCLNVEENETLNLTFSPSASTKQRNIYAYVNGIEIISMPTGLYYTPDHDLGAPVVGHTNRLYYLDNSTALEMVQRLNVGGSSILPVEDFGMFRGWSEDANHLLESRIQPVNHLALPTRCTTMPAFIVPLKIYQTSWKTGKNLQPDEMHYFTWKIPVDLGFGYLVRLHFCDSEPGMTEGGRREFNVLVNNQIAESNANVIRWSGASGIPVYRDYVVMIKGDREEGKSNLFIALQSVDESIIGLLNAVEIFKMSNPDNSLASPNPVFFKRASTSWTLKIQYFLLAFGKSNSTATGLTILIILVNVIVYSLRQISEEKFHKEKNTPAPSTDASYRSFSLAEIISGTQNFSDGFIIGKGGFGNVYKGLYCGGSEVVAIKRLKPNSKQGAHEFWTEIETLAKLKHIHLVSLIGYCNEGQEMILVYEYMPRGTLADNLYKLSRNGKKCTPLTWEQRLRICIGAARGLDYLHAGTAYGVIHRDVKASNILLDENLVAKISDVGLSKLEKITQSHSYVSTKVKGTFGYLDPDYIMTLKLTRKTDVYAFGVVLLVVLCGKPALDTRIPGETESLISSFRECTTKGGIDDIIDPSLRGKISSESLSEFLTSIESCLHHQPKERPTMAQVVARLEYALERQQFTPSSISDEAISVGQPCEVENMKPPHFDQFTVPPMLEESVTIISPVEEGIIPQAIQTAEVKTRGEVYQSREKDQTSVQKPLWGWPWEALRNRGKPMKKKDLGSYNGHCFPIADIRAAIDNFSEDDVILNDKTLIPETPRSEGEILLSSNLKSFTFAELKAATRHFRPDNILGEGGFGFVFKGWIYEQSLTASKPGTGMVVAVKKLNQEGLQGHKEWLAEINYLGQLRHPNLVKLIGYCLKDDHRLLVYEFMPKSSLDNHLYKGGSYLEPLSWTLRIKIALGAARGLAFVHGAETKVIYRDFRTSNILLDSNYNAKLSDFGLARDGPTGDESHVSTRFMGTYGYAAPEYISTGHFTTKSNVYSFGVVLLEILTGKKLLDLNRPAGERNLVDWTKPYLTNKRKISRVLDARLGGQYSLDRALELANVARQCLSEEPKSRPTMDEVVTALEQLHDSKNPPNSEKKG